MTHPGRRIAVPAKLFRSLVMLQAHYGWLLNGYDGGGRNAVPLPADLEAELDDRAKEARKRLENDR